MNWEASYFVSSPLGECNGEGRLNCIRIPAGRRGVLKSILGLKAFSGSGLPGAKDNSLEEPSRSPRLKALSPLTSGSLHANTSPFHANTPASSLEQKQVRLWSLHGVFRRHVAVICFQAKPVHTCTPSAEKYVKNSAPQLQRSMESHLAPHPAPSTEPGTKYTLCTYLGDQHMNE